MRHGREVGSERMDGRIVLVIALEPEHKPLGRPNIAIRVLRQVGLDLNDEQLLVAVPGHPTASLDQAGARIPKQRIAHLSGTVEGKRFRSQWFTRRPK